MPKKIMDKKNIIILWGILDLGAFAQYIIRQLSQAQIPFYHDIIKSFQVQLSFGAPSMMISPIISIVSYISLVFSGILLIKQHRVGATLGYIQTPLRMLAFIPPSVFFISWLLKVVFDGFDGIFKVIILVILILTSEIMKLYSLMTWRKQFK